MNNFKRLISLLTVFEANLETFFAMCEYCPDCISGDIASDAYISDLNEIIMLADSLDHEFSTFVGDSQIDMKLVNECLEK